MNLAPVPSYTTVNSTRESAVGASRGCSLLLLRLRLAICESRQRIGERETRVSCRSSIWLANRDAEHLHQAGVADYLLHVNGPDKRLAGRTVPQCLGNRTSQPQPDKT